MNCGCSALHNALRDCRGSGATGRALIQRLAQDPRCAEVTAFARRPVDVAAEFSLEAEAAKKVTAVVCDHDNLVDYANQFEGQDVAFTCIGTSRVNAEVQEAMASAGADEGFRDWLERVDLGYTVAFAELAAQAGIKHLSRCSARNANAADDGPGFHIYWRFQGKADDAVCDLAERFPCGVTCFRPGSLDRGELRQARPHEVEKAMQVPGLPVSMVAEAMHAEWVHRCEDPANTMKIVEQDELIAMVGGDTSFKFN